MSSSGSSLSNRRGFPSLRVKIDYKANYCPIREIFPRQAKIDATRREQIAKDAEYAQNLADNDEAAETLLELRRYC